MGQLFYFSSASGNTQRFVSKLDIEGHRLPLSVEEEPPRATRPYVLICPTYSDGNGKNAVALPVRRFLHDPDNGSFLRGVIAAGNRSFGKTFALAGDLIAQRFQVPVLYRFELAGTPADVSRVRVGLERFWEAN